MHKGRPQRGGGGGRPHADKSGQGGGEGKGLADVRKYQACSVPFVFLYYLLISLIFVKE